MDKNLFLSSSRKPSTDVSSAGLVRAFNIRTRQLWGLLHAVSQGSPAVLSLGWPHSHCSSVTPYWSLPLPVSVPLPFCCFLESPLWYYIVLPERPHTLSFLNPEPQLPTHMDLIVHLLFSLPCWETSEKNRGSISFWPGEEISQL